MVPGNLQGYLEQLRVIIFAGSILIKVAGCTLSRGSQSSLDCGQRAQSRTKCKIQIGAQVDNTLSGSLRSSVSSRIPT